MACIENSKNSKNTYNIITNKFNIKKLKNNIIKMKDDEENENFDGYTLTNLIIEEKVILQNNTIKVKKYKKGKHLGKGGFANCFEITNLENGSISAVKVIPKNGLIKPRAKQKLITEIKIHKSLNHPNIVQFQHYFEDLDNVYLLLEMCHNQSLNELIKRRKRLSDIEVQCYMLQIVKALKYLHSNRVIHRDLKLGNLFISNDMELKLGDFGLATRVEYSGERKRTVCGTPNYIAPEILEGKYGHSYEVDIWALGVILYTLLVGKPPFESSDVKSTYRRIKMGSYSFPEDLEICEEAKSLIIEILRLDPLQRPNLEEILKSDYLQMNKIPKLLPASTLACPLNKSYLNLFTESSSNSKLEKSAISQKLQITDFPYVKKWIDYSTKYGLVYSLSNGNIGFVYNDNSKMILDNENNLNYIERKDKRDILHKYSTDNYPYDINKKVKLIFHFKKYLDNSFKQNSGFVYVKRWLRTSHCILLRLSNKIIQIIFYDHSVLILNSIKKTVLYIDIKGSISEFSLNNALETENNEMKIRLRYARDIITYMLYNTFDNNKINDIEIDERYENSKQEFVN
jgi:polo-like kinase 1